MFKRIIRAVSWHAEWRDEERRHVGSLNAEESGNTAWSRRQVGSLSICLNTTAYEKRRVALRPDRMLDVGMGICDGRTVRVERGVFARKEGKW